MTVSQVLTSLYFRISAFFLLLLLISAGGYYLLVNATIFTANTAEDADHWFAELAADELDELALRLMPQLIDSQELEQLLVEYGQQIDGFDAEVAVLDAQGIAFNSSDPDSLTEAIGSVRPSLLDSMLTDDWDWDSYPIPDDIDAWGNRIFEINNLWAAGDSLGTVDAYLVASFRPYIVSVEEMNAGTRGLRLNAGVFILICAALSGLLSMAWLSRRIHVLGRGVIEFKRGNLSYRIPDRSQDEIGQLALSFNGMAGHLESLIQKLREKEEFQRQLVANISHDLRTPMASIRGYVETLMLRQETTSQATRDQYLSIISANLEHLDTLVEHLLVLSRLDSGQAEFNSECFPLPELVDAVLERCSGLAEKREIKLDSISDDSLPMVLADPLQIGQVLQNLIDNGIKFNRPGGTVTIEMLPHANGVQVQVKDTGLGIRTEDVPHVCERFYTGDKSRTHKGESSGLGLAISNKILAAHGTELTINSVVDEGTCVAFQLPIESELAEFEARA